MGEYDFVGGREGDYIAKPHSIEPFGFVATSDKHAFLKRYSKRDIPNEPFSQKTMDIASRLVLDRIENGSIDKKLGLGFMILSNGYINVSFWGGELPSLLNNSLFGFKNEENMAREINELDIRKEGTYCVWELGVVEHEARAWRRYLQSKKEEADKIQYLNDSLRGTIR